MSHDAARDMRTVRGRVVDGDGRAVDGVRLDLFTVDETKPGTRTWLRRTTTGADGSFEFDSSDDFRRMRIDALPLPQHPLRAAENAELAADGETVIVLPRGAGIRACVVDAAGLPIGGPTWRLWLDSTLPGWPPRDRREEYGARLAALDFDTVEFEEFAALPGSCGGVVANDGSIVFSGLECGSYWVQLSRVDPDRRRCVANTVVVESGEAEVVDGMLVLNGPATIVVRAD
jgi:hypothetical protein